MRLNSVWLGYLDNEINISSNVEMELRSDDKLYGPYSFLTMQSDLLMIYILSTVMRVNDQLTAKPTDWR